MCPLLFALAHAGPLRIEIAGVEPSVGLAALVRTDAGVEVASCADDGASPDDAVDGRWTCAVKDVSGSEVTVGAVVDGRAIDGGSLTKNEGKWPEVSYLQVAAGIVTVSADPRSLTPLARAAPSLPASVVVARLVGYGGQGAPVVTLTTESGTAQLTCSDDGRFPDATRNDGQPACIGATRASSAGVAMQAGNGVHSEFGRVSWAPGPLSYVTLDVARITLSIDPFPLVPAARPDAAVSAGAAESPKTSAAKSGAPGTSANVESGVGKTAARPSAKAVILAFILAFAGVGVGWMWRGRRSGPDIRALRRHPAPPLIPGGPTWADGAVIMTVADPVTFAAALLPILARERRVVLVVPDTVVLPPSGPCSVWVAAIPDWTDVLNGIRDLADSEGPELAVLVVGADTLQDPGAVTPNAMGSLVRGLPPGVWFGAVVEEGEIEPVWLPQWRVSGPAWTATSAAKS